MDTDPKFSWQCFIFISTLISNCKINPQNIFVHLFDSIPLLENFLSEAGVNIVRAARWGDLKYLNKLCQFNSLDLLSADYIFLCDCDIAFIENIEEIVDPEVITAKTVDAANPEIEVLDQLFDKYHCQRAKVVETCLGKSYATNCNGGLYGIPRKYFKKLGEKWKNYAERLLNDDDVLALLGEKHIHIDQIAFSMALSDSQFNFKPLHTIYNTPTHFQSFLPKILESIKLENPKVLHFHDAIDEIGLLKKVGHHVIDASIDSVNETIKRNFRNKLFWDFRYAYYPSLGSGIGSRGELLKIKQKMLKLIGIEKANSILDVGCGDGEVLSLFKLKNYTGIDISEEALRVCKTKHTSGNFLLFTEKESAMQADLVICLDVLLHQDTPEDYDDLIDYISRKTQKRLIVSGYRSFDQRDTSCMCFYHKNLYSALSDTGRFTRIFKFFEYRNLDVMIADKEDPLVNHFLNSNDIDESLLSRELEVHNNPDFLLENVIASRSLFGWFTKHYPRIFEYPWILKQTGRDLSNKTVADFGAGISALPLLLSMRGAKVYTVDHGPELFLEDIPKKCEWGFLDYGLLDQDITSINVKIAKTIFAPASIDVWYSVSVIEHLPRVDRLDTLRKMRTSLKKNGKLLLTIDVCKRSDFLWNYSAGSQVEPVEEHGTIETLRAELEEIGFTDIKIRRQDMPSSERVDIGFVSAISSGEFLENNAIHQYEQAEINLDIGGQNNRNDQEGKWKIVDLHEGADYMVNLESDNLPLEACSVSCIYSSHCIEHIEPNKLKFVFSEMHRVLKPDGRIRIVVPSFRKGVFYYFFAPRILKRRMMPRINSNMPETKMARLSSWFYTETNKLNNTPGHKSAWDFELVKAFMQEAGFTNIKKRTLKQCSQEFKGKDNPNYQAFSLYVEGQKVIQGLSHKNQKSVKSVDAWREKMRLYWDLFFIKRSKHFDAPWYLFTYPDVKNSGVNPMKHYLRFGWREGRDPSGLFSTNEYIQKYPYIFKAGICPLVHYVKTKRSNELTFEEIIPSQVLELITPLNFKSVYELGNKKTNNIPYALYYRSKGIEYTSIDLNGLDGAIPLDLSTSIQLPRRDAVLNIGTSEHVFDQKSVFRNIHNLSNSRMIHWVPIEAKHEAHGYWGYSIEFFKRLSKLNNYKIEKLYIESTFKDWVLVCCSYKKTYMTPKDFYWPENYNEMLHFNDNGSGGVDYR